MTGVRACVLLSVILGTGGGGPPGQDAWGRSSASQPVVATAEPASPAAKTHSPEDETLFNRAIEVLQEDPFHDGNNPRIEIADVAGGHVTLTFLTAMCEDERRLLGWLAKRPVADAAAEAAMLRCFLVFKPVTWRLEQEVEEIIHCRRLQVAVEKIPGCKGVSWVAPDEVPLMRGLVVNAADPAAHNNVGVMLWLAAEQPAPGGAGEGRGVAAAGGRAMAGRRADQPPLSRCPQQPRLRLAASRAGGRRRRV